MWPKMLSTISGYSPLSKHGGQPYSPECVEGVFSDIRHTLATPSSGTELFTAEVLRSLDATWEAEDGRTVRRQRHRDLYRAPRAGTRCLAHRGLRRPRRSVAATTRRALG